MERKFVDGYSIVKVLSNNSYELLKPNGKTFKVNVHHIRPYGMNKWRKDTQSATDNLHNCILRNRETLNAPNRLTYKENKDTKFLQNIFYFKFVKL